MFGLSGKFFTKTFGSPSCSTFGGGVLDLDFLSLLEGLADDAERLCFLVGLTGEWLLLTLDLGIIKLIDGDKRGTFKDDYL